MSDLDEILAAVPISQIARQLDCSEKNVYTLLAEAIGMSVRNFGRAFAQETGITPHEFVEGIARAGRGEPFIVTRPDQAAAQARAAEAQAQDAAEGAVSPDYAKKGVPVTGARSDPPATNSPRAAARKRSSRGRVNFSPESGTSHSTTDDSVSTPMILSFRMPPPRLLGAPRAATVRRVPGAGAFPTW